MTRLEPIPPSDFDPEQKSLYINITKGPRAQGPKHFDLTRDDGKSTAPSCVTTRTRDFESLRMIE